MDSFKQFITERRRNSDRNPRLSVYDQIKPYLNDNNVFLSFTELTKLGINPNSKKNYNTPNGIYCYPLKQSLEYYGIDPTDGLYSKFPFASDTDYFWLFRARNPSPKKIIYISDSIYTRRQYDEDVEKMKKYYGKTVDREYKGFDDFIGWAEDTAKHYDLYAGKIWNVTRCAANNWKIPDREASTNIAKWNWILREILGYDGAWDIENEGVIHENEDAQAVFFSKNAIKPLIRVKNNEKELINFSGFDRKNQSKEDILDYIENFDMYYGERKLLSAIKSFKNQHNLDIIAQENYYTVWQIPEKFNEKQLMYIAHGIIVKSRNPSWFKDFIQELQDVRKHDVVEKIMKQYKEELHSLWRATNSRMDFLSNFLYDGKKFRQVFNDAVTRLKDSYSHAKISVLEQDIEVPNGAIFNIRLHRDFFQFYINFDKFDIECSINGESLDFIGKSSSMKEFEKDFYGFILKGIQLPFNN